MKKNSVTIPYGYREIAGGLLEPIPEELEALKQAVWYQQNGSSYRAARDWLVLKTGRPISIPGFFKVCQRYNDSSEKNN